MVGLDATIVNIALPAIHRSLGSSLSGLQWTVDAYTLVLASLLMLAGSTADRVGRKRVFQVGLLVFALGSLLCALAPTAERADRRPGASGDRRLDVEPGGDVDHPHRVRRSGRARPRDRRLRGDVRAQHRARARARRHAGRRRRLAGRLPRERAGRRAGVPCHPPVRARVARRAAAPGRSRRSDPRDRRPGIAHVRDHRGARPRLGLDRDRGGTRRGGAGPRRPYPVRAAAARAPARDALVPQRAVLRRQRDRASARSRRSGRSCS